MILRVWSLDHEVPLFYFPLSLLPPSFLFSFLSHLSTLALGFAYIVCVLSRSVMSSSLQLHGLKPARLLCPWEFSRLEYWSGLPCPPPEGLPIPGIEPRSPTLWADSLLSEPPGNLKNTEVGRRSILQGSLPTQELNQGLLHCRQNLYPLSYLYVPKRCFMF